MPASEVQVSVLGDIAWQEVLVPDGRNPSQYKRHTEWIGAPLIRQMIQAALTDTGVGKLDNDRKSKSSRDPAQHVSTPAVQFQPDYAALALEALAVGRKAKVDVYEAWDALIDACGQYSATLSAFPRRSRSEDTKDTVLRVARDLRAVQARTSKPARIEDLLNKWAQDASGSAETRRIVVVYDRGLFLRENIEPLQAVLRKLTARDALIFAIEGEVEGAIAGAHASSTLDQHLEKLLDCVRPAVRDRAIVVLTADSLRKSGLRIVEYGHLEQAVRDVVTQMGKTPLSQFAKHCRHIVVSNQESALLHVVAPKRHSDHGPIKGSIHICPNWDKLAQGDYARYGFMPGKLWIVLTAIVMKVHKQMRQEPVRGTGARAQWELAPALRLAIVAFNRYSRDGFDRDAPFKSIKASLSYETRKALREKIKNREREFLISSLGFVVNNYTGDMSWSRLSALIVSNKTEQETLYRIVEEGVDAAFREKPAPGAAEPQATEDDPWFPGFAIDCPYAEFGDVKLVDEREISNFISLSKLIEKYLRDESWTKPLSIAVFGAPGSGKSFAVKEIIKSVSPEKPERDPPTFNLAQFSSVQNLTDAFHMVQDRVLASSAVPLVIFDEFDCFFEGSMLGWLKYFLAPMQDGQFHGHNQDYRIGRAIFLFSGGTAETYKEFREKLSDKKTRELRAQVKLNDFVSRLRGHLDVLSLSDEKPSSQLQRVRRAILLRSVLEKLAKPILSSSGSVEKRAAIQRQVTDKFLSEWNYEHGVRSVEAVIQASRWIGGAFVMSSLPEEQQLASHVQPQAQTGRARRSSAGAKRTKISPAGRR